MPIQGLFRSEKARPQLSNDPNQIKHSHWQKKKKPLQSYGFERFKINNGQLLLPINSDGKQVPRLSMAIPQRSTGAVALTQSKTLSCVLQCTAIILSVLNGPHCPTYIFFINIYITEIWSRGRSGSDGGTTTKTENREPDSPSRLEAKHLWKIWKISEWGTTPLNWTEMAAHPVGEV